MDEHVTFPCVDAASRSLSGMTGRSQILLLFDNCTAYGNAETASPLHNNRIEFLPPDKTSKVLLLDVQIVATVKERYRH